MQRFEVLASKRAGPDERGALERAFERIMAGGRAAVHEVEIAEVDGLVLVRMDLAVPPARQATRRGEEVFAYAWYDAFGERAVSHLGRVVGSRP